MKLIPRVLFLFARLGKSTKAVLSVANKFVNSTRLKVMQETLPTANTFAARLPDTSIRAISPTVHSRGDATC